MHKYSTPVTHDIFISDRAGWISHKSCVTSTYLSTGEPSQPNLPVQSGTGLEGHLRLGPVGGHRGHRGEDRTLQQGKQSGPKMWKILI